jgi:hypothetical protein
MKSIFILLLILTAGAACKPAEKPMKVNKNAKQKLNAFILKSKLEGEPNTIFNRLSKPELQPKLNNLLNQVAKDFLITVDNLPTEKKFENNIGTGLARFNAFETDLDTEDKERICHYFEEIMDCVGLKNSNGQLNDWMY